jgi:hypothetical protein
MKSVCIYPGSTSSNWQAEVAKTAKQYWFTVRTVATFEPNRPLLRQEFFALTARVADWKGKNPDHCKALPEVLICK